MSTFNLELSCYSLPIGGQSLCNFGLVCFLLDDLISMVHRDLDGCENWVVSLWIQATRQPHCSHLNAHFASNCFHFYSIDTSHSVPGKSGLSV